MLSSFLSLIETTGSSVQISVQRKQQNKTEIGIKILKFFLSPDQVSDGHVEVRVAGRPVRDAGERMGHEDLLKHQKYRYHGAL